MSRFFLYYGCTLTINLFISNGNEANASQLRTTLLNEKFNRAVLIDIAMKEERRRRGGLSTSAFPDKIKKDKKDRGTYCFFHKTEGHYTKDCYNPKCPVCQNYGLKGHEGKYCKRDKKKFIKAAKVAPAARLTKKPSHPCRFCNQEGH